MAKILKIIVSRPLLSEESSAQLKKFYEKYITYFISTGVPVIDSDDEHIYVCSSTIEDELVSALNELPRDEQKAVKVEVWSNPDLDADPRVTLNGYSFETLLYPPDIKTFEEMSSVPRDRLPDNFMITPDLGDSSHEENKKEDIDNIVNEIDDNVEEENDMFANDQTDIVNVASDGTMITGMTDTSSDAQDESYDENMDFETDDTHYGFDEVVSVNAEGRGDAWHIPSIEDERDAAYGRAYKEHTHEPLSFPNGITEEADTDDTDDFIDSLLPNRDKIISGLSPTLDDLDSEGNLPTTPTGMLLKSQAENTLLTLYALKSKYFTNLAQNKDLEILLDNFKKEIKAHPPQSVIELYGTIQAKQDILDDIAEFETNENLAYERNLQNFIDDQVEILRDKYIEDNPNLTHQRVRDLVEEKLPEINEVEANILKKQNEAEKDLLSRFLQSNPDEALNEAFTFYSLKNRYAEKLRIELAWLSQNENNKSYHTLTPPLTSDQTEVAEPAVIEEPAEVEESVYEANLEQMFEDESDEEWNFDDTMSDSDDVNTSSEEYAANMAFATAPTDFTENDGMDFDDDLQAEDQSNIEDEIIANFNEETSPVEDEVAAFSDDDDIFDNYDTADLDAMLADMSIDDLTDEELALLTDEELALLKDDDFNDDIESEIDINTESDASLMAAAAATSSLTQKTDDDNLLIDIDNNETFDNETDEDIFSAELEALNKTAPGDEPEKITTPGEKKRKVRDKKPGSPLKIALIAAGVVVLLAGSFLGLRQMGVFGGNKPLATQTEKPQGTVQEKPQGTEQEKPQGTEQEKPQDTEQEKPQGAEQEKPQGQGAEQEKPQGQGAEQEKPTAQQQPKGEFPVKAGDKLAVSSKGKRISVVVDQVMVIAKDAGGIEYSVDYSQMQNKNIQPGEPLKVQIGDKQIDVTVDKIIAIASDAQNNRYSLDRKAIDSFINVNTLDPDKRTDNK